MADHLWSIFDADGSVFSRPERMRMFLKQYITEMTQLGINSIGIVLIISFFIGAVICIQMKLNIQSPWMPRWVAGYTTREILLLEFSSSIMCLILAGKVGSNIASEPGHHACYPADRRSRDYGHQFSMLSDSAQNHRSAHHHAIPGHLLFYHRYHWCLRHGLYRTYHRTRRPDGWTAARIHPMVRMDEYHQKSVFAFIISSVPAFCGYTVEGGSVNVGKASTDAVVTSSVLILFSDVFLTQLLS